MRIIKRSEIINTVADLCKQAAYVLPKDIIKALNSAKQKEKGLPKKIIELTLKNARIASTGIFPLCQDTGTAVLFVELGQKVQIEGSLERALQEGVKKGFRQNYLRKSIVFDPLFNRVNTKTNTPAVIHYKVVNNDKLKINLMLKGGGAENKSRIKMFNQLSGHIIGRMIRYELLDAENQEIYTYSVEVLLLNGGILLVCLGISAWMGLMLHFLAFLFFLSVIRQLRTRPLQSA